MTEIPIIDADGHILENQDELRARIPEPFNQKSWTVFPPYDTQHHGSSNQEGGFKRRDWKGWLDSMDEVGISIAILYPTLGLACAQIDNPESAIFTAKAYNDWLAENFLDKSPRLKGMGIIPFQKPDVAVEELRRVVKELKMPGVFLPPRGKQGLLGNEQYWPIYEEANRLGCAIGFHNASLDELGLDTMQHFIPKHALGHPYAEMNIFGNLLFNGVFDRYPNVRFGFLEAGAVWPLLILERFDRSYSSFKDPNHYVDFGDGKPSDLIKAHIKAGRIFIGCEGDEEFMPSVIKALGSDPFMYSSDISHEVTEKDCIEEINKVKNHPELRQEDKEAIIHGNAKRFYGLKLS